MKLPHYSILDPVRILPFGGVHELASDLVLCWRFADLRGGESLLERLSTHGIEMPAVAQSCTALMK